MEYPKLLTVEDVKGILRIGNDKAYKLFQQDDFPSFKLEERYYIKEDRFYAWLDTLHEQPKKQYILSMMFNFS